VKPKVFRSTPGYVFGWVWMAFAAANLVDIAWRGRDVAAGIAAASLLLGAGVAYVIGMRPRIVADEEFVRLHNPLQDIRLPWRTVDKIETRDAIEIRSGDRTFRAYALQTSPRARVRAEARSRRRDRDPNVPDHVAEYVKGKLPIDFAADQLNELAERTRRDAAAETGAAAPAVSLAWTSVTALAAPAAALIVLIVIAAAG
jgi:hypothetical protein